MSGPARHPAQARIKRVAAEAANLRRVPMNDLWNSLRLSLEIALVATALTALVGVPLALLMSRPGRFAGKALIDALITLPLVLPPTVVGYVLLVVLGANGWLGRWLHRA